MRSISLVFIALVAISGLSCRDDSFSGTWERECQDGKDNDGDGLIDCADDDCSRGAFCHGGLDAQTLNEDAFYSEDGGAPDKGHNELTDAIEDGKVDAPEKEISDQGMDFAEGGAAGGDAADLTLDGVGGSGSGDGSAVELFDTGVVGGADGLLVSDAMTSTDSLPGAVEDANTLDSLLGDADGGGAMDGLGFDAPSIDLGGDTSGPDMLADSGVVIVDGAILAVPVPVWTAGVNIVGVAMEPPALFLADSTGQQILKFDPQSSKSKAAITNISGLTNGLADLDIVHNGTGDFFSFVNTSAGDLYRIDSSNVAQFPAPLSNYTPFSPTAFAEPGGLTRGLGGDLFVATPASGGQPGKIARVSWTTGAVVDPQWATIAGTWPLLVADEGGTLYVCQPDHILAIAPDKSTHVVVTGLSNPTGLHYQAGSLYIADDNWASRLDLGQSTLVHLADLSTDPQFGPTWIVVDLTNKIFLVTRTSVLGLP